MRDRAAALHHAGPAGAYAAVAHEMRSYKSDLARMMNSRSSRLGRPKRGSP